MSSSSSVVRAKDVQKAIDDYLQYVPPLFKRFFSGPPPLEENFMFNVFGQQRYLLIAKFDFATLPVKLLRRLPVYLLKQFAVQVELDSLWYWALTHDIVESAAGHSVFNQWSLKTTFSTLLAAWFAELGSAPSNWTIERLNRIIDEAVSQPVKDLVMNRDTILMYLCYPVLEGIVKFAMLPIVDSNGMVKATLSDGKKTYNLGQRLSSLATLLRLLEKNASKLLLKPNLASDLEDFRLQTEILVSPQKIVSPQMKPTDGWDLVYYLRNVALHGVAGWQLRSGLITNLICLIIWHLMDDQTIEKELQMIATRPKDFFWPGQYYPPRI